MLASPAAADSLRSSKHHRLPLQSVAEQWRARRAAAATQSGPPPVGLHLIRGADTAAIGRNTVRNLEEGRIAVVQAVFRRP